MTIIDEAAAALRRHRADVGHTPSAESVHVRRARAAMARDIAAMLGAAPACVVVTGDPAREHGGYPGSLISVHDPAEPGAEPERGVWRFIPETGNTGGRGGAYQLLDQCTGCGGDVPMATVFTLADLGRYLEQRHRSKTPAAARTTDNNTAEVPIEFFHDPGHHPSCRMTI